MGRKIDLTGQQFGKWKVLKQSSLRNAGGCIKWTCQCECGTIRDVDGTSLRKGKSTNCGCENKIRLKNINFKDLTGERFDKLIVISQYQERDKNNQILWKCKCDCGNICLKTTAYLHRKNFFHSCGCYGKEQISLLNKRNLIGQKFGKLTVLQETSKRDNSGNIIWKCRCDCGNQIEVRTNSLTTGNTQSCGCINYSIGEKNIEKILKQANINFKTQYTIPELKLKKFDFAIFYQNSISPIRLIEFDGQQHFMDRKGLWNSTESLEDIQKRDKQKNQWAKDHNIPLVRIPYWERDNITLDMILGNKYLIND